MADCCLVLGVDLGTTSVKVSVVEPNKRTVIQSCSEPSNANIQSDCPLGDEQDAVRIVKCLDECVGKFDRKILNKVTAIVICGQMHGCVFWSTKRKDQRIAEGDAVASNTFAPLHITSGRLSLSEGASVSSLYTWQDGRCSKEFLSSLPHPSSKIPVSTGYGCATLAWLHQNNRFSLSSYQAAGTVMDLVVCGLIDTGAPVMSVHNAVSWGYFNHSVMAWDKERLLNNGFPVHLLPQVVTRHVAGLLCSEWHGIPAGVSVSVGLGDLQCSVKSVENNCEECVAVLNMGTSSQLILMGTAADSAIQLPPSVLELPYFNGTNILVAASLNGGNVLSIFMTTLTTWLNDLGVQPPSKDEMFDIVIKKGLDYTSKQYSEQREEIPKLTFLPTFFGERHNPTCKGSVYNIGTNTVNIGEVFAGLCQGLIKNLLDMMPLCLLQEFGVKRVVCSGSAMARNLLLQKQVEQVFNLPVKVIEVDASMGASLVPLE